ncbi:MAG: tryptophan-rich sensory protein [Clostridiales bacterium]|nr:tryptophan-rich sensory protein [Clostridiales bacterium]
MWKKYKPYIVQSVIALAVGALSFILVRRGFNEFNSISKPFLTPPPAVYPAVWTLLFILMGVSAGITSKIQGRIPFVYWLQLFVNFLWPIIFFGMKAYLFAFVWLVLLWILIISMIMEFKRIDKRAAYLQIPYLIWVTFAGYLNFSVWLMNM